MVTRIFYESSLSAMKTPKDRKILFKTGNALQACSCSRSAVKTLEQPPRMEQVTLLLTLIWYFPDKDIKKKSLLLNLNMFWPDRAQQSINDRVACNLNV